MLDRLKALPLTIVLTILIWMYAEAQFTAVHENVRINVKLLSASPEVALRAYDAAENRYSPMMNLSVTLQGPKQQIERIYQDSLSTSPDDDFAGLVHVPDSADLLKAADTGKLTVDTVPMLNHQEYFKSRGVTVTAATPTRIDIEVDHVVRITKPAEFHPAQLIDRAAITPETVELLVPSGTLTAMGGAQKLTVTAIPLKDLSTLAAETEQIVAVRFAAEYPGPRDDRVRVVPAQGTVTVHIPRRQQQAVTIPDVPVWVSGPPALLNRYEIDIQPRTVSVSVAGPGVPIDALQKRIQSGGARASGVMAYLDITGDERPATADAPSRRRLRYVLPDGLTLLSGPSDVSYRLLEKLPAPPVTLPTNNPSASGR